MPSMNERTHAILALLIVVLTTSYLSASIPVPLAVVSRRHLNPIPYYGQGNRPWCGVATTRMIIAYVLYPQAPSTLEDLAKEMGATEDRGTTGHAFQTAMSKRGISREDYETFNPEFIRSQSSEGYAIEVTIKVYPRYWPTLRELHAIVIIGYDLDRQSFLVHDPDKYAEMTLREDDLREKWYYCEVVRQKPRESPSYSVKVRIVGGPNHAGILVDGVSTSIAEYRFMIGTSHTIKVTPKDFKQENTTHRITYFCTSDLESTYAYQWVLEEKTVLFTYYEKMEFWVRIDNPSDPRSGWFEKGASVTTELGQRTMPAEGLLGLIGFKKVFLGWYDDGKLLSSDLSLALSITRPMNISSRWELRILGMPATWLLIVVALGCVIVILSATYRKKQRASLAARVSPIPSPVTVAPVTSLRKYCPECGFDLPLQAKQCSRCRTEQYYFG